ncbi:hypothetical protein Nepgr_015084 [Nepenthes gracilis]|uniref:Cytochrome P450 n=1 Tax=Nepenthes gracilis TaxID=150966 RepID=A0AAD3XQF4_NEPGR|nr:hypothetical protein Nepgr_015084 [Nepenthes gracilis]
MDFSASSFSSYYHLIFISLALIFSTLLVSRKSKQKPIKLPPGPPGWPVVGNLFQFSNSGKQFFEYARDLLPVYGPIFTLKMGSRTMIIISSADLAHEALIQKGMVFASRPSENPTRTIFSCDKFTVNSAEYGPVWRSLRRNMVQNMLSSSRMKEFRDVRDMAMDKLIERIRSEAESNDGVVWVLKNARFAAFCILLAMCFGVEMSGETIEKVDQMMKDVLITLDPRIDDYLPLLRPFFSKQRKQALQVRRQQIETLVPFIEKRRDILRNPGSGGSAASFSYLDTIFNMKIEGRKSSPTDPEIVTLCSEFINGGTDTTGTAIEWGMARLIENPAIQSKLYEEIAATVGSRKVKEQDLEKMVYLHAFCKELLRKHPPTYFSLTHAVTEPATLAGYDIPTGTNVEFFLPAISEDPKLWSSPQRFDPDRFLSGGEDADITGVTGVKMLPFGAGRRICPGLAMATVHVHLMIARMVQEFEWSSYPEGSKIDFGEKLQFTVVMKNPLRAKIKARVV